MPETELHEIGAWIPVVGRWSIEGGDAQYHGMQPGDGPPFGICVAAPRFATGTASAMVTLGHPDTSGRILLGYRAQDERYLCAGLHGYRAAYNITEFQPSIGWTALAVAGDDRNLELRKPTRLNVSIRGQEIRLEVDGVRVLVHRLRTPPPVGQLGLFAWGPGRVHFTEVRAAPVAPQVFVVMQLSAPYEQLYREVIQPVVAEFHMEARHVGEVFGPGVILNDIAQGILDATVVIAEVTPTNQNVFYELGFAHALGKPTILLAERGKQLPFDISGYRCLFYDNTIGGKRQVEEALRKHLQAITHD